MSLYWQKIHGKMESAALSPGLWLEISNWGDDYSTQTLSSSNIEGSRKELLRFSGRVSEEQILFNIECLKKQANVIAQSYMGQQHPYRDYPRGF
jgi:hypothetical protein